MTERMGTEAIAQIMTSTSPAFVARIFTYERFQDSREKGLSMGRIRWASHVESVLRKNPALQKWTVFAPQHAPELQAPIEHVLFLIHLWSGQNETRSRDGGTELSICCQVEWKVGSDAARDFSDLQQGCPS